MKGAVDKVSKDLGQVGLIEATLKAKKWDTTTTVMFLNDESLRVHKTKNEVYEKWVTLKQDDHALLSEDDMKDKTKEASGYAKNILDTFKAFGKDVLMSFALPHERRRN